eukprot:m.133934 g.133934  ORF g.133934 m.133934 type:complete len:72 (-) comp13950_c0_seq3:155-370(-)
MSMMHLDLENASPCECITKLWLVALSIVFSSPGFFCYSSRTVTFVVTFVKPLILIFPPPPFLLGMQEISKH